MAFSNTLRSPATSQSEPITGTEHTQSHAEGSLLAADDWAHLQRFLAYGSVNKQQGTSSEAAQAAVRCIQNDGSRTVREIVEISSSSRVPTRDSGLFVLALTLAFGDDATKQQAVAAMPQVAGTGAHILCLASYVDGLRGWGRGLRNAFAVWYNDMPADKLAYQVLKYQRHNGWTHRDILRLAHPRASTPQHQTLYHLITQGHAATQAQMTKPVDNIVSMIEAHDLPHEVVSIEYLTKEVWSALLAKFAVQ